MIQITVICVLFLSICKLGETKKKGGGRNYKAPGSSELSLYLFENPSCSHSFVSTDKCANYNFMSSNLSECYQLSEFYLKDVIQNQTQVENTYVKFGRSHDYYINGQKYEAFYIEYYDNEECEGEYASFMEYPLAQCVFLHQHLFPNNVQFSRAYSMCKLGWAKELSSEGSGTGKTTILISLYVTLGFILFFVISMLLIIIVFLVNYCMLPKEKKEKSKKGEDDLPKLSGGCGFVPFRFFRSVVFIISLQFRNILALFFSIICIAVVPADPSRADYVVTSLSNTYVQTWLLIFFAFYTICDSLLMLLWLNRHIVSPFQIALLYSTYREWLFYRHMHAITNIYFAVYCIIRFSVGATYYPDLAMSSNFEAIVSNLLSVFAFITPFLILFFEIISINKHDSVGSIALTRKLRALSCLDVFRFPEPNVGVFSLIFSLSPEKLLNDCYVLLSMIRSKRDVLRFRYSDAFRHLPWMLIEKLSEDEVLYLRHFFFSSATITTATSDESKSKGEGNCDTVVKLGAGGAIVDEGERQTLREKYFDLIWFAPPFSFRWVKNFFCFSCLGRKELMKGSEYKKMEMNDIEVEKDESVVAEKKTVEEEEEETSQKQGEEDSTDEQDEEEKEKVGEEKEDDEEKDSSDGEEDKLEPSEELQGDDQTRE